VPQDFEIVGAIEVVETIATGNAIREIAGLIDEFGAGRSSVTSTEMDMDNQAASQSASKRMTTSGI